MRSIAKENYGILYTRGKGGSDSHIEMYKEVFSSGNWYFCESRTMGITSTIRVVPVFPGEKTYIIYFYILSMAGGYAEICRNVVSR